MASLKARTRTLRTLDLSLGPGRTTLRLALVGPGDDEPATLVISLGFGGGRTGDPFMRPPWAESPLRIPADMMPELRVALEALEEVEP